MPTTVTIQGTTYTLPSQSDSAPWGDNLSNLVDALIAVANNVSGPADILTTSFTIANNVASVANVTGLSFDTSTVRSAIVQYSVYRSSNTPNEKSECGVILLAYKSTAGTWELAQTSVGNAGVTFSITNGGQLQYTSTDVGSGAYVGKMKFAARSFLQA